MAAACAPRRARARARFRLDLEIARRSFRRFSSYRAATACGVVTNAMFGFLRAYVLVAVVATRDEVGGLDQRQMVTYVFVGQALIAAVGTFNELELGERIRSGDVVMDLYRPVHVERYWLAHDLGRATFQFLGRGLLSFAA